MSVLAEPIRLALAVGREFDALSVLWVVGGSVASSIHGLPRSTQDIDLVASLGRIHAGPLSRALEGEFYVDREAQLERRQPWQVGEAATDVLPVLSPEDVVLQKLRWFSAGGGVSERQWRDVVGVLAVRRGALDLDYMRGQAAGADLAELLERALADASS